MITYAVKNKVDSRIGSVHFDGEIGEFFDRFIYNRITSDVAVNEVLHETETVFEE